MRWRRRLCRNRNQSRSAPARTARGRFTKTKCESLTQAPDQVGGFFFSATHNGAETNSCYHGSRSMPRDRQIFADTPARLAQQITEGLLRERIVPRFVDSYVVENGRQALQVHASLYRDLLTLLQREALLALSVRALEIVCNEPRASGRAKPRPMLRRDATAFRRKYLASLARQQGWTAGDTLDFQRDLQIYQESLACQLTIGAHAPPAR